MPDIEAMKKWNWKNLHDSYLNYAENHRQQVILNKCFRNMKARCENPTAKGYERYGGRGIKCFLTYGQLYGIWERDKAVKLKRPSIDRIDPDGHYILENCRFIELIDNIKRKRPRIKSDLIGLQKGRQK